MMAERRQLMKRLDRMSSRSYTIEDLSEVEADIYGSMPDWQQDKKESEKNARESGCKSDKGRP